MDQKTRYEKVAAEEKNPQSLQQRAASCMAQSDSTGSKAIQFLNKYLSLYQNDNEAWKYLKNLYLRQLNYEQAKFCLEELILISPNDYLLQLQYAETLAAIG